MSSVRRGHRFTGKNPCPICGGSDDDRRGASQRCYGFLSDSGEYANCTREEFATDLMDRNEVSETYTHSLDTPCICGVEDHRATKPPKAARRTGSGRTTPEPPPVIIAAYQFHDANKKRLYDEVWFATDTGEKKKIRMGRPIPGRPGEYDWGINGLPRVPYHLPDLLGKERICVAEGCKDADTLCTRGFIATTNPFGAGKWTDEDSQHLVAQGVREVTVFRDEDPKGHQHQAQVIESCQRAGITARPIILPGLEPNSHHDITDWFAQGHTVEELDALVASVWTAEKETPAKQPTGPRVLPIQLIGATLSGVTKQVLQQLADQGKGRLFHHGNVLARLRTDEERPRIEMLSDAALRLEVDEVVRFRRGKTVVFPPVDVVRSLQAVASFSQFQRLIGLTETPFIAPDYRVITEAGYNAEAGLILAPSVVVAPVPAVPTTEDVQAAVALLMDPFVDFPFVADGSKTNVIGFALTPFIRSILPATSPAPMLALDANQAGAGKDLVLDVLGVLWSGSPVTGETLPHDSDELDKRILSAVMAGAPIMYFSNVNHRVDSAALAGALTKTSWSGRQLGFSKRVECPLRHVWLMTGKNLTFSGEMTRRQVLARLVATWPEGERRNPNAFKHPQLLAWVIEHRAELIHAALVLCQNWVAKGRPMFSGLPLASFEDWCGIIGGILEAAGVEGFLANSEETQRTSNVEGRGFRQFIEDWANINGDTPQTVANLVPLAAGLVVSIKEWGNNGGERGAETYLGMLLQRHREQVWRLPNGRRVQLRPAAVKDDNYRKRDAWQLAVLPDDPPAEEDSPEPPNPPDPPYPHPYLSGHAPHAAHAAPINTSSSHALRFSRGLGGSGGGGGVGEKNGLPGPDKSQRRGRGAAGWAASLAQSPQGGSIQ